MNLVTVRNAVGLIASAALLAAMPVSAQKYPERTITMIVPFGAGGSTDIVGRIAADAMSKALGVSMIIENKGGAGGTVGAQAQDVASRAAVADEPQAHPPRAGEQPVIVRRHGLPGAKEPFELHGMI